MKPDEFVGWFVADAARLRELPPAAAVDAIYDVLVRVHPGLALEIGENGGFRELIVSAQGDTAVFPVVEEIVGRMPAVPGWEVIPLKPPQGFAFEHEANGQTLSAQSLFFEPLTTPSRPLQLGIRVYAPAEQVALADSAIRRILQTGLGERLEAELSYADVHALPADPSDLLKIEDLPRYITWFREKNPLPTC